MSGQRMECCYCDNAECVTNMLIVEGIIGIGLFFALLFIGIYIGKYHGSLINFFTVSRDAIAKNIKPK